MNTSIRTLLPAALTLLAAPAWAQLSDLQPGRNFPTAAANFGAGRSSDLDVGDLDNDGDLDVVVANGGDGSAQPNVIYVNQGGAQGGLFGVFVDESAARFAGMVVDTSRDVEFSDFEGDGDLDLIIANRGTTANGGEPTRAYVNLGGRQHGAVGYFSEVTNTFFGSLVSVPLGSQVLGGNQGPFRDYSCDCEFGDLDLDGDVDLFHSSYGPNISGTIDSRVFLNDDRGRFDELWPWADPAADTKLHTWDIDIFDMDADFDLDVFASSRDSQARVYRNNLDTSSGTWPSDPFTDVTQQALLDTGAVQTGGSNYEVEYADFDGDGDFDVWANNYNGFSEAFLRNRGDGVFDKLPAYIKGDPNVDEQEIDALDYDGDGDLDLFIANFSGTNSLYQNGLADGVDPGLGLLHRTGTTSLGSLAAWNEVPTSGNSGTTLDGECADMDNDGDPDILLANDANQQNRYWSNVLGVPDTHAPTIWMLTAQADKADGSDTPIRVALRDNSSYYEVATYSVDLVYRVDGGLENRLPMASQWGMQFQATIPGGIDGAIAYRVEGADRSGNAFVSAEQSYVQTSSGVALLQAVGSGTSGSGGIPDLALAGPFTGGSSVSLSLTDAAPSALSLLFFSLASTPLPFKGGLLHTVPVALDLSLATDDGGLVWVDASWPGGISSGVQLWQQFAIADAAGTGGATLSNAVLLTAP